MLDTLIIFGAKYLIALPVLLLVWYFFNVGGEARRKLFWLGLTGFPVAYLLGTIAGYFFYNALPFVISGVAPLVAHAANNGFPSDHMLLGATLAQIALYTNRKLGVLLWIVAIIVGTSRVLAGVHHGVDIFASAVIAVVAVWLAGVAVRRLQK